MDELGVYLDELPTLTRLREDLFTAFAAYDHAHALLPEAGDTRPPTARTARHVGRARSTRLRVTLAAIVATAVLAVLALTSGGGRAAWAVQLRGDGTVSITLNDLLGVSPANARLRALGLPVTIQQARQRCSAKGELDRRVSTISLLEHVVRRELRSNGQPKLRWIIYPAAIPQGDTLGLVAQLAPPTRSTRAFVYQAKLYRGSAPGCISPGTFSR